VFVVLHLHTARTQGPARAYKEADWAETAGGEGPELQLILPCKPKQVVDRRARVDRQRRAPATVLSPEPQRVIDRAWRLRRALAALQQPARDGEAHKSVKLQPHEQIDEDVVGQPEQRRLI
jgi:hypothetical protein